ncbi:hypothetical protein BKK79_29410 [Cupriavidus sp. USMAA2-4]|uniref:hypothetical protein n=1 Tax=Cupriavidus sp. USMAA2-4 TaxID=876364 RepID=UPI0008A68D23|nr:hypothetical protein [Cupriavidus sp. USMAA2-4]AOY95808.1 hypothetical protein BKK79_29410 [Cupriavidus sp. USMAA2-4]
MNEPIIDTSGAGLQAYLQYLGRGKALRRYLWFRLARPAIVAGAWLAAAYYIYRCVLSGGGSPVTWREFVPQLLAVAAMALALSLWAFARLAGEHRPGAHHTPRAAATPSLDLAKDVVLAVGAGRRLVAYHDQDGLISRVAPLQQELA